MDKEKERALYDALNEEIEKSKSTILAMDTSTDEERNFIEWVVNNLDIRPTHCAQCMGEFMRALHRYVEFTQMVLEDVLGQIGPQVIWELNQSGGRALDRVLTKGEIKEAIDRLTFEKSMHASGYTGNPNN